MLYSLAQIVYSSQKPINAPGVIPPEQQTAERSFFAYPTPLMLASFGFEVSSAMFVHAMTSLLPLPSFPRPADATSNFSFPLIVGFVGIAFNIGLVAVCLISRENADKTLIFVDGRKYNGDSKQGLPHGRGAMTFPDGRFYKGNFINGNMTEHGRMHYPNGEIHQGKFNHGEMVQKRRILFPNGYFYKGQTFNGKPDGRGTYVKYGPEVQYAPRATNIKYVEQFDGFFKEGKYHGYGVLITEGRNQLIGAFKEGKSTDLMLEYVKDKEVFQIVQSNNDSIRVIEKIKLGKDMSFEGLQITIRNDHIYIAESKTDEHGPVGEGPAIVISDKSIYHGSFVNGLRNGAETLINSAGETLTACYENGVLRFVRLNS